MKIAAAYIRVSTDDQVEYSPASQLDALRKYAKNNDMILSDELVFSDEGISGRKADKRPGFQSMIGMAKKKPRPFDVILVWKFSRFARNREDSIVYKSMLKKDCGIEVISITELLSEDKTSILMETLIEAMDEYYSANLAEEVKRGLNEKVKRGEAPNRPPFGFKIENNMFVPDKNAPVVRKIFEDYADGVSMQKICNYLNENEIYTINNNKWIQTVISSLLSHKVYIGKIIWNGEEFDGLHEAIVPPELFQKVQEKLADNQK